MSLETGSYINDLVVTNPTGTDPKSQGDDHFRLAKTALKNCFAGFTGAVVVTGTDGGAVNAYTLTPAHALPAYGTKMIAVFAPTVTNTGAVTLNISGLGVKNVKSVAGAALVAGDLVFGCVYAAFYDGTEFRLTGITKNYADQLAMSAALPAQPGGASNYKLRSVTGVASWVLDVPPQVVRSARTANTILAESDRGTLIDITANTFSQTLTAAVTLGDGWYCWYKNSGTGDVTLDPNGAELIDGDTGLLMYSNEMRLITCTGSAFHTTVLNPFNKIFTASGTFVKPPGYKYFEGEIWNGGNSGSKSSAGNLANAGAGGGAFPFKIPASSFGATETITIGAGGAGQTVASTPGNVGGVSSIGTLLVMTAAVNSEAGSSINGATTAAATAAFGFEGNTASITPSTARVPWGGSAGSSNCSAASGNALYGGAAGGSVDGAGTLRAAGTSKYGGNGGAASSAGNGADGTAPGGGGGATQTGATSGAGARGELRIRGA